MTHRGCNARIRPPHAGAWALIPFLTAISCAGCISTDAPTQTAEVALLTPTADLFVGSYLRVPVRIRSDSSLRFDELEFEVAPDPAGGSISESRDARFDAASPSVMLLVGSQPGTHELRAVEKATKKLVGRSSFTVSTLWPDEEQGPPQWVSGDFELPGVAGAAWGGGSSSGPENFGTSPAIGERKIAVLLLDTASECFTASETQSLPGTWADIAFDGALVNGKTVSTAHYFDELSGGKFTPKGTVYGPVSLPGLWSDYLHDNGSYKGNLWQACVTAGDALIDFSTFQHLACVIRSVSGPPARRVWAHADSIVAKTSEGDIPLGVLDLPADGAHASLVAVFAHEFGHNLGLGDIYKWNGHPPQIQAREVGGWDLMAAHSQLPHVVLAHRMLLGWIPSSQHLRTFHFQSVAAPVDETVSLHPVESGAPPAGRYSGIEVRVAPDLKQARRPHAHRLPSVLKAEPDREPERGLASLRGAGPLSSPRIGLAQIRNRPMIPRRCPCSTKRSLIPWGEGSRLDAWHPLPLGTAVAHELPPTVQSSRRA